MAGISGGGLFHDPAVYVPCLGAEVDPDSEDLAGVHGEREGVLLLLYLLQGLLCRAVELELHHVHVVRGLHDHVYPAPGGMVLHPGVEPCQAEYDEQHVLVVELDIPRHLVRAVCEETLEPLHESVHVAGLDILDELPDRESALAPLQRGVVGEEEVQEPLLDLPVRESELEDPSLRDISLDGEVSALVYDPDRVPRGGVDAVEDLGGGLLVGEPVQGVTMHLEEFDEICRSPRLEPVAAVFS